LAFAADGRLGQARDGLDGADRRPAIAASEARRICSSSASIPKLRHSKIAVTMEIYTEVPSAATRDALRKLGQWLDS
jgi:hypothetical protein